jgi:hypothetical protein
MKKRVICDTMIWYEIGKGNIDVKKLEDVELIATGINIQEISSSENLLSELDLVKSTLEGIENHSWQIIEYEPWDYLLTFHVHKEYEPKSREMYLKDLKAFDHLIDSVVESDFEDEKKRKELNNLIKRFNDPIKKLTTNMNSGLIKVREKGSAKYGSRKNFVRHLQSNENSFLEIMDMFKDIFAARLKIPKTELDNRIDWANFELLFRTWDFYLKEKSIISNAKFHENDFFDLTNMAYVGKDDLYWTMEKNPWLRILNENEVTKKYVFEYVH